MPFSTSARTLTGVNFSPQVVEAWVWNMRRISWCGKAAANTRIARSLLAVVSASHSKQFGTHCKRARGTSCLAIPPLLPLRLARHAAHIQVWVVVQGRPSEKRILALPFTETLCSHGSPQLRGPRRRHSGRIHALLRFVVMGAALGDGCGASMQPSPHRMLPLLTAHRSNLFASQHAPGC